ncbi:hypothetical protein MCA1547 [Methylococcus capsulatus str. Bath]|uniref:Uncharacterized protein n=1 Tax=Methylococcus capsulatus (strain ATCC 33009 / NCIMB 11132 / Bath) TaxID=243233 RepID=Q608E5_METCA|nr:hypothetical protein MCA1547 [Methylococcus capsulatus str. Bath]
MAPASLSNAAQNQPHYTVHRQDENDRADDASHDVGLGRAVLEIPEPVLFALYAESAGKRADDHLQQVGFVEVFGHGCVVGFAAERPCSDRRSGCGRGSFFPEQIVLDPESAGDHQQHQGHGDFVTADHVFVHVQAIGAHIGAQEVEGLNRGDGQRERDDELVGDRVLRKSHFVEEELGDQITRDEHFQDGDHESFHPVERRCRGEHRQQDDDDGAHPGDTDPKFLVYFTEFQKVADFHCFSPSVS